MVRIAIAIAIIMLAAALAQAQDVRYTLTTYAAGTNTPISTIKAGQRFDLAVIVTDLRPT